MEQTRNKAAVYDSSLKPYQNNRLIETASTFIDAGFKIANANRYREAISDRNAEFDASSTNPDVALVCNNSVSGAVFDNALVFLSADVSGPAHLYTALSKDTEQSTLDKLKEEMDVYFYKLNDGTHFGYLTLQNENEFGGLSFEGAEGVPFHDAVKSLQNLDLQTVKIPMDPEALSMLPIFADKHIKDIRNDMESAAELIHEHLGFESNVFESDDENIELKLSGVEVKQDNNHRQSNSLRNRI